MKILLTRSLLDVDRKYITDGLSFRIGDQFQILAPETYDDEGLCKLIPDADVLLGPFVTENMLAKAERLKLIQIPWTGLDTFNFGALINSSVGDRIALCNTHSNAAAVAELGVGLILDLLKKISYHDRKMRQGNWNRGQQPLDLKSAMLADQTVCILGYGSIGRRMGKMLSAFGTKVIAVSNKSHDYPEVNKLYGSSRWIEAVEHADICVCALPLTPQTKGQINAETIGKMAACSLICRGQIS
jgi:D-3-phosphoglycerate dehydrogenase